VKARLEKAVEQKLVTSAEPTAHCDICSWWPEYDAHWRKVDHLSLVAGISRLQRKQLSAWEVTPSSNWLYSPCPSKSP